MTQKEAFVAEMRRHFDVMGKQWMLDAVESPLTEEGDIKRREAAYKYQQLRHLVALLEAQILGA